MERVDKKRATPAEEEAIRRYANDIMLNAACFAELENLGYGPQNVYWRDPIPVSQEIAKAHLAEMEKRLGVPLKAQKSW